MLRKPVFAANWKMNHGPTDAKAFLRTFLVHFARRADRSVVFFPPALTLHAVTDALRDRPFEHLTIGDTLQLGPWDVRILIETTATTT